MQYFGSNNVEGVAESWVEAKMSWVEVDGAGWRWVHGLVIPVIKHKFHPSIVLINGNMVNQDKFSFKPISKLDIEKVQPINPQKSSIPLKILKISSKLSADVLQTFSMIC